VAITFERDSRVEIIDCLENNPIIAALHNNDSLADAVASPAKAIFLLSGNILQIADVVNNLKCSGKKVFVHVDLIDGLGKDIASVDYIKQRIKPHGILSTRSNLLKHGKEIGLITVQRLFLLDSRALNSGVDIIKSYHPDFVEVLPGIIPRGIEELKKRVHQPIIAGGMITLKEDVIQAIKAGALAVSTSKKELWQI
jgi:glycerol uptake operon antiterminator